jgi:ribosome-binding factor A
MADPARARKLADRIKVVVAETLEMRVKDPRLGFVTITDVRVTNDLQQATIFYTVLGDDAETTSTAAALESAKGVLRSEVGKQTGVRFTPSLEFQADVVPDTARHIEELLARAAAADAEVHRAASGAQYAGDADPYRAPVVVEDDEPAGDATPPDPNRIDPDPTVTSPVPREVGER